MRESDNTLCKRAPRHDRPAVTKKKQSRELQQCLDQVLVTVDAFLEEVHGATKRLIADDKERLKVVKESLLAIGKHIEAQAPEESGLRLQLWVRVASKHWPQKDEAAAHRHVTGEILAATYARITRR